MFYIYINLKIIHIEFKDGQCKWLDSLNALKDPLFDCDKTVIFRSAFY